MLRGNRKSTPKVVDGRVDRWQPSPVAFDLLPEWVIRRHKIVPLSKTTNLLVCAISNLEDADAIHVVSSCAGGAVRFVLAIRRDIERCIWQQFESARSRPASDQAPPA